VKGAESAPSNSARTDALSVGRGGGVKRAGRVNPLGMSVGGAESAPSNSARTDALSGDSMSSVRIPSETNSARTTSTASEIKRDCIQRTGNQEVSLR